MTNPDPLRESRGFRIEDVRYAVGNGIRTLSVGIVFFILLNVFPFILDWLDVRFGDADDWFTVEIVDVEDHISGRSTMVCSKTGIHVPFEGFWTTTIRSVGEDGSEKFFSRHTVRPFDYNVKETNEWCTPWEKYTDAAPVRRAGRYRLYVRWELIDDRGRKRVQRYPKENQPVVEWVVTASESSLFNEDDGIPDYSGDMLEYERELKKKELAEAL